MKDKKSIWLLEACSKSTENYIKLNNEMVVYYPNRYKVRVSNIVMATTRGDDVCKNFIKVFTKKRYYYLDSSLLKFRERLSCTLVPANLYTLINPLMFNSTLNLKYLFSKYLENPVRVGEKYTKYIEPYFENT